MFNDISKAMAFFESLIQERDNIQGPCGQEFAEQKNHYIVAVDCMRLIISDPKTTLRLSKQDGNNEI